MDDLIKMTLPPPPPTGRNVDRSNFQISGPKKKVLLPPPPPPPHPRLFSGWLSRCEIFGQISKG